MNPRLIVIDGKTYRSVDEMPEDVRRQYEQALSSLPDQNGNRIPDVLEQGNVLGDANKNGIPDILEGTPGERIVGKAIKILVDGHEFTNLDELPPEARAKYEKAMGALDADRNGIPDFMEGMMGTQQTASPVSVASVTADPVPAAPPSLPVTPTITPDTTNGWLLALLGLGLLFLCVAVAGGVWYFFLR